MQNNICVGTMLWGTRTTEQEAHNIIDCALNHNVNFFDTAAKYPTFPYKSETEGISETILGNWIKRYGKKLIVSTKMKSPVDVDNIMVSIESSLHRLGVDAIDYYQFHWPNRGSYCFRQNWSYDPFGQHTNKTLDFMYNSLEVLNTAKKQGKIINYGMSNETAWGITKWNQIAKSNNFDSLTFIQNEYSLLHRIFELDLAEACHHENIKLLAWTPLAGGLLTGKYTKDFTPANSRRSYGALGPRDTETVWLAIAEYQDLANKFSIDMAHMSILWVLSRPFVKFAILGATTATQLEHNLKFHNYELTPTLVDEINKIYKKYPIPF